MTSEFIVGDGVAAIKSMVGTAPWAHDDNPIVPTYDPNVTSDAQSPTKYEDWDGSDSISVPPNSSPSQYWYFLYPWDTGPTDAYHDGNADTDVAISVFCGRIFIGDGLRSWDDQRYVPGGEDDPKADAGHWYEDEAPGGNDYRYFFNVTVDRGWYYSGDYQDVGEGLYTYYGPPGYNTRYIYVAKALFEKGSYMSAPEWGPYTVGTGGTATTKPIKVSGGKASFPVMNSVKAKWVATCMVFGIGASPTISTPAGWTVEAERSGDNSGAVKIVSREDFADQPPTPPSFTVTGADYWGTTMGCIRPSGYGQEGSVSVDAMKVGSAQYPKSTAQGYEFPFTVSRYSHTEGWDPVDGYSKPYDQKVTNISEITNAIGEIDLHMPTLLKTEGMSWTFRFSEDLADHELRAQKAYSVHHDYTVNDLNFGETYRSVDQAARGWYEEEFAVVEKLEIHGGLDNARWALKLVGLGKAVFTDGDTEEQVSVQKDVWYTVDQQINAVEDEDGNWTVSYALRQGDDTLAAWVATVPSRSITGFLYEADATYYPQRCYYGPEVLLFGWPQVTVEAKDFNLLVSDPNAPVSESEYEAGAGWNQESPIVTDGRFSIDATPMRGSVNVYDEEGHLLDYGDDWEEVDGDDTGMQYVLHGDAADNTSVRVVYYIYAPTLEVDRRSRRPQQDQEEQARKASLSQTIRF